MAEAYRGLLLSLLHMSGVAADRHAAARSAYGRWFGPLAGRAARPAREPADSGGAVKVGFVSSDFRDHPIATHLGPIFEHRDPKKLVVAAYSLVEAADERTAWFQARADIWRQVAGRSDQAIAELVAADRIDVLVLVAGSFDGNRPLLAFQRAAPVQASLFDADSSRMAAVDYWIGDATLVPPGSEQGFSETVVRLPCIAQYRMPPTAPAVMPGPSAQGGAPVFASFNNPAKLTEESIRLWSRVLQMIPAATLKLKYMNRYSDPAVVDRLTALFAEHGIAASRLDRASALDSATAHLGFYDAIDVALDTVPFNGHTTTLDALMMGVPVVTRTGDSVVSRLSAGILREVGLGELVAETDAEFARIASDLVRDRPRLAALRGALRARLAASRLCDPMRYAADFERTILELWRAHRRNPSQRGVRRSTA
jgi:predicted O-linked N-acetylglucosamine transferase (SPINDLY family)